MTAQLHWANRIDSIATFKPAYEMKWGERGADSCRGYRQNPGKALETTCYTAVAALIDVLTGTRGTPSPLRYRLPRVHCALANIEQQLS